MNICIRIPRSSTWSSSVSHIFPSIRDAYTEYKERPHYYREMPYLTSEYIVYRPDNDPYLPTYIAQIADILSANTDNGIGIDIGIVTGLRTHVANNITISQEIHETLVRNGTTIPIIDMNDISVFIVDNPGMARANWLSARAYQVWAYRDFMYDPHRSIKKSYMSRGTSAISYESNDNILANQIVTIDVANISPNIVFNISRNDNNSVYFERNDERSSRVRICDNEYARMGYLGFYTRITMDPGIVVMPPQPQPQPQPQPIYYGWLGMGMALAAPPLLSSAHLSDPEEIDDEEHQCILCFKYRVNARFSPCAHTVCCSSCYSKMEKNECPVCRAEITQLMNI